MVNNCKKLRKFIGKEHMSWYYREGRVYREGINGGCCNGFYGFGWTYGSEERKVNAEIAERIRKQLEGVR